jgi:hypothetical protein
MAGFGCNHKTHTLVQRARCCVRLKNGYKNLTPLIFCTTYNLSNNGATDAASLVFGCYANRVQFKALPAFKVHEKTNGVAIMLDNACVVKLKLLTELLSFFSLVPNTTRSRDMRAHSAQEHIFEET